MGAMSHEYTRSKKNSQKNEKDLGMACHTPPFKKNKETRGNAITHLIPIPFIQEVVTTDH